MGARIVEGAQGRVRAFGGNVPGQPAGRRVVLTGDRKGTRSLSVTRNRRLTFRIDTAEQEICDVNLEDYP